ncbi:MAG: hypothetical protein DIU76_11315 [Bacillota bacterium]|nr:MAG: hypothetical protein DIU76_11315 [Bacillota bacterium]
MGGLVRVCSFCGKTADQVEHIVAGETAAICNECVALCQQIIHAERERSVRMICWHLLLFPFSKPRERT